MSSEPYEIQVRRAKAEDTALAIALIIGIWAMYMGWI